jgi:two-component system chemotaxis response regulator CheB
MKPVRLVVVDDSSFVRKAMQRMLESETTIQLVGAAASGEELIENLSTWRPEVITLDLNMPGMDGLSTLDRIMSWKPIRVIILSTHSQKDAPLTLEALHRGAVDFIDKQQYSLVDFESLRRVVVQKILQVSRPTQVSSTPDRTQLEGARAPAARRRQAIARIDLVLIGASTGGPPAIQWLLERLEAPLPVPFAIVQHMPPGFTTAFAQRLDTCLPFRVCEPTHGEPLLAGSIYIAPAGTHLELALDDDRVIAHLIRHRTQFDSHRPSVDALFHSAATCWDHGLRTLPVLLTGMGKDGAQGMAELAQRGACTIAQSEASCVIYGMPRAAMALGGVCEQHHLSGIARRINEILAMS